MGRGEKGGSGRCGGESEDAGGRGLLAPALMHGVVSFKDQKLPAIRSNTKSGYSSHTNWAARATAAGTAAKPIQGYQYYHSHNYTQPCSATRIATAVTTFKPSGLQVLSQLSQLARAILSVVAVSSYSQLSEEASSLSYCGSAGTSSYIGISS